MHESGMVRCGFETSEARTTGRVLKQDPNAEKKKRKKRKRKKKVKKKNDW